MTIDFWILLTLLPVMIVVFLIGYYVIKSANRALEREGLLWDKVCPSCGGPLEEMSRAAALPWMSEDYYVCTLCGEETYDPEIIFIKETDSQNGGKT